MTRLFQIAVAVFVAVYMIAPLVNNFYTTMTNVSSVLS